tara:strand:+ start:159 stop:401 length:243 start_codon:yes stop_codon:yes gene_type:complete
MLEKINTTIFKNEHINQEKLCKMNFIYNAICSGWTVRKLENNKFEFTHSDSDIKKKFILENFLDEFVKNNITIDKLITMN